ncbi:uncharacterized protein [Primulina huaijiensis]|uniref:uncharacterized protein isoform X2 n=1 Tax=Primulina huaijiensis TaxID=1492673 RepID=UPI003CC794A5
MSLFLHHITYNGLFSQQHTPAGYREDPATKRVYSVLCFSGLFFSCFCLGFPLFPLHRGCAGFRLSSLHRSAFVDVRGTANNAGAILVLGRDLVVVPKLTHPLSPAISSPETSPEHHIEDTWMQELNANRPPTPTRGRPQVANDRVICT